MSIAEQMGATLVNTACSVNIKERLDFSCAVFDGRGDLVANAPHLPVHLGSMGASVKAVLARHRGALRPGDAYLLNSPYAGGTHLPDLTVVTPVFAGATARTAPARRRGGRRRRPRPCSSSPPAPTTPTSAASRPARCRPAAAASKRRAC